MHMVGFMGGFMGIVGVWAGMGKCGIANESHHR
jgi:hypothetical protein